MAGLFGKEGIRGIANIELTPEKAFRLGQAGAVALMRDGKMPLRILVGKDTRISGDMLEAAISAGICSVGVQAVSIGVIPTPALAYLVGKYKMDGGVMISASREPVEYNGIKFFDSKGCRLSDDAERMVEDYMLGKKDMAPFIGSAVGRITHSHTAMRDYVDYVRKATDDEFCGMKIAIDCANGAAYQCAKLLFRELGADVEIINNVPDGVNINRDCGMLHPERLADFVVSHRCTFGLVLDGDADMVLAVDENGNVIGVDEILAVCAVSLKSEGRLCKNTVAVTSDCNPEFVQILERCDIECVQVSEGERCVLDMMVKNGYCIGGDGTGHIIFSEYNSTGDGLVTSVELTKAFRRSGLANMSEFVANVKGV